MKRISQLLPVLLLFACWNAWGQSRIATPTHKKAQLTLPKLEVQPRQEMDTILYPVAAEACGDFVFVYLATPEWGYVGGTNGYLDLEKAQRLIYTSNAPYRIREVWGFFSHATDGEGDLLMKVYSVDDSTGGPDSLLGTSDTLQTGDIQLDDLDVVPTIFPFSDSVVLEEDTFFVSLDIAALYATEDTVALFLTEDGCGDGYDAWELFVDSTWVPIDTPEVSWGLESNWAMAAVVEFDESTDVDDPFVAQEGLRIFPASPNPTNTWIELPFQLDLASVVNVEVYSANGTLVQRMNLGQKLPGQHRTRLDVQALPPGTYVYSILTENARLMSRFVVSH